MPGMGSGFTCRSTASVRTAIKPNLRTRPHSHPTRVLLRWIRGGDVWCRSTALGANWAGTHSHPGRLLLPREGVGCLPLTSPAHHLQRHPIPGRVAPAVLLHTRSYCSLLLDHSLHGNRFNLTPLLYSQMKATRESSEAIDFATVSGLRLWPFKPSRRLFP